MFIHLWLGILIICQVTLIREGGSLYSDTQLLAWKIQWIGLTSNITAVLIFLAT